MEKYDLEEVYDEEIRPHMDEIIRICQENHMPVFASFAYRHTPEEEDAECCTTNLHFKNRVVPEFEEFAKLIQRGGSTFFAAGLIIKEEGKDVRN